MQMFPMDELGSMLKDNLTFGEVFERMQTGEDIYGIIGVGDSLVRERIFEGLADILTVEGYEISYADIYYLWGHGKLGKELTRNEH